VQRPAHVLALQYAPEPGDLVRGLEKRVVAVEVRVLSLDDILDCADRCRCDVPDALDVLGDERVVTDEGIDPAVVDVIDKMPAKPKPKLVWSTGGPILQVPDEDDEPVPEFVLGAERDRVCRNPR
jgi:hypothetical protein